MRYKIRFALGLAAGYVLGARAGRERYDQLLRQVRGLRENPSVQETAGVLQAQASHAVDTAKQAVTEKVAKRGKDTDDKDADDVMVVEVVEVDEPLYGTTSTTGTPNGGAPLS